MISAEREKSIEYSRQEIAQEEGVPSSPAINLTMAEEGPDNQIFNCGAICCKLSAKKKSCLAICWYTLMVVIYILDVVTDCILGVERINNGDGPIVFALVFLPAFATIVLAIVGKTMTQLYEKKIYKWTLVELDWLDIKEGRRTSATARTIILILLRIQTVWIYLRLLFLTFKLRCTCGTDSGADQRGSDIKRKKKELKKRLGAEIFIETCFESLPQMCLQLYLFGTKDVASFLEIVSFSISMLSLVISFTSSTTMKEYRLYKEEIVQRGEREIDFSRNSSINLRRGNQNGSSHSVKPFIRKENKYGKSMSVTKVNNESSAINFSTLNENEPEVLNLNIELVCREGNYNFTDVEVRSRKSTFKNEMKYFFFIKLFNIVFESILFLLTAFPTISLFSSLFGVSFIVLFIPVLIHLVTEYWWWRPTVYKSGMTRSFYAIFLAFKVLERLVIFVMICIWFIKVMELSKPLEPPNEEALIPLIWPTPNRFLETVATYEMGEDARRNMSAKCIAIRQSDSDSICAIDVSSYLFCFIFYINIIGGIWEAIHFVLIMVWKNKSRREPWKDMQETREIEVTRETVEMGNTNETEETQGVVKIGETEQLLSVGEQNCD